MREDLKVLGKQIADLEERNVQFNIARDEPVAEKLSTQEELNYCKFDSFRKHVIDDFRSGGEFAKEVGKEAATYLDKGSVHIIWQLHHHFKGKSILLQAFKLILMMRSTKGELTSSLIPARSSMPFMIMIL